MIPKLLTSIEELFIAVKFFNINIFFILTDIYYILTIKNIIINIYLFLLKGKYFYPQFTKRNKFNNIKYF